MTTLILATALLAQGAAPAKEVDLGRVFTKGEKLTYAVRSRLNVEQRGGELRTWMPEDLDVNYDFIVKVGALKADRVAAVQYLRPTMTIIEGETHTKPPSTKIEKSNIDLSITVSPTNELLEIKDNAKPVPKRAMGEPEADAAQGQVGGVIGQFVSELYRLSLFSGSLDSSLDFSPKLRAPMVAIGDTWHKTVGYQPQRKSKTGKNVVQRLDYEYTYKGPVTINGKTFQRIEATLNLDTDLAEFIRDQFDVDSDQTGIAKVPMKLSSKILFNLDPITRHTHTAEATTEGGYQIFLTSTGDTAVQEARLKGSTVLKLVSRTIAK